MGAGNLTASPLLLRDGELCGVIDVGCSAAGDPACDLTVAWTCDGPSRNRFAQAPAVDHASAPARWWTLWKAVKGLAALPEDHPRNNGARLWRWHSGDVINDFITATMAVADIGIQRITHRAIPTPY